MNDEKKFQRKSPLEGVGRLQQMGAAAVGLMTFVLATVTAMPPARPAMAAPKPSVSPSSDATPGSATPSGSPSESPAAAPSGSASGSPGPSVSPSVTDSDMKKIENIVSHMEHLNPKMKDSTSDVAFDGQAKYLFLMVPLTLHGKSYHKTPDKYKVELQNVPDMMKKYQQVFDYRPVDLSNFTPTLLPDETVNGRPSYVLKLDKKGTGGDFRSMLVWVDKENYTSPHRTYLYNNDGKVDITFTWRKEKGFIVFDTMAANLSFPKNQLTANVKAQYSGYQFDTGLDDAIFSKKVSTSGGH